MMRKIYGVIVFGICIFGVSARSEPGSLLGVPTSNNIISGSLRFRENSSVQFCAREGTLVKIKDEESGYNFAVALRKISDSHEVKVLVFEVSGIDGQERVKQIDAIQAQNGVEVPLIPRLGIAMRIQGWGTGEFRTKALDNTHSLPGASVLENTYSNNECCVICRHTLVCATSVEMDCGTCTSFKGTCG
jgi:hypothetical protein